MKKYLYLLILLVLFNSCNPEDLMNSADGMNALGRLNFSSYGNETYVKALDTVSSFQKMFDDNVSLPSEKPSRYKIVEDIAGGLVPIKTEEDYTLEIEAPLSFNIIQIPQVVGYTIFGKPKFEYITLRDGEHILMQRTEELVEQLLDVKDSLFYDKVIRESLNTHYTGKISNKLSYRNVYDLVMHSSIYIDYFIPALNYRIIELDMESLRDITLPFPIQAYDFSLLVPKLKQILDDHLGLLKAVFKDKDSEQTTEVKPDKAQLFLDYLNSFSSKVGERSYQTVGDKISIGVINNMLRQIKTVLEKYEETGLPYEDFSLKWVITNCMDEASTLLNSISVIEYIYGYSGLIQLLVSLIA